jgi:hypothetical protein
MAKPGKQHRRWCFKASTEQWDDLESLRNEFDSVRVAETLDHFLAF